MFQISEGRNKEVVDQIASAIKINQRVKILGVEMEPDHNRSIITFVSPIEYAFEAAFNGIKKAAELIDMNKHNGANRGLGHRRSSLCSFVRHYD